MMRNTLFVGTALALLASARSVIGQISPKVLIVDYVSDLNASSIHSRHYDPIELCAPCPNGPYVVQRRRQRMVWNSGI